MYENLEMSERTDANLGEANRIDGVSAWHMDFRKDFSSQPSSKYLKNFQLWCIYDAHRFYKDDMGPDRCSSFLRCSHRTSILAVTCSKKSAVQSMFNEVGCVRINIFNWTSSTFSRMQHGYRNAVQYIRSTIFWIYCRNLFNSVWSFLSWIWSACWNTLECVWFVFNRTRCAWRSTIQCIQSLFF